MSEPAKQSAFFDEDNSIRSAFIKSLLSGNYDPVAEIVKGEQKRGFTVVRPGNADWFCAADWKADSIASMNGSRVRLLLLISFVRVRGALTRTIAAIEDAGLVPSVVDPIAQLADTLRRRGWRTVR